MTITKQQFEAFEEVRLSGATNMWDTRPVADLSDGWLKSDEALEVIKQYSTLCETYPDVRDLGGVE